MSPDWFLTNTSRYDHYDRSGPKVFAGEYAAQSVGSTSPDNRNNWKAAISEAAFMTGLERNGDVVQMASYAPLMAQRRRLAMEARRDLVRQSPLLRHARLLRPESLRQQHRNPRCAFNAPVRSGTVYQRRSR